MDKKGGNMRKTLSLLLIGLFSIIIFLNCAPVIITAPPGEKVSLLTDADPATARMTKKIWYAFYGLVPLTNNSTAPIIKEYALESIRVNTKFDVVDCLISMFTSGLIVTKTIEIEGNPKK